MIQYHYVYDTLNYGHIGQTCIYYENTDTMREAQNKRFVNELTRGLSVDFISGMFILNFCWYSEKDKEYIWVNKKPLFKKKINVDWKIQLIDIKVCEAVPISTEEKELVIFHTKRKEKRIISQEEIRRLLVASGKAIPFDEREADRGEDVPNVSKAFYIESLRGCLK